MLHKNDLINSLPFELRLEITLQRLYLFPRNDAQSEDLFFHTKLAINALNGCLLGITDS